MFTHCKRGIVNVDSCIIGQPDFFLKLSDSAENIVEDTIESLYRSNLDSDR